MTPLQKILTMLYQAALNDPDHGPTEVLRGEMKAAFRMGWKAQRDHGPNSLQGEEAAFARYLDGER